MDVNPWSKLKTLPFFNMSQIRQLIHSGSPIYGYDSPDVIKYDSSIHMDSDDYDYDTSENMEDESTIIFPGFESVVGKNQIKDEELSDQETYAGLSGDSLAFTLVYVSVFSITLLYVGLKLAKRWREKQNALDTTESGSSPRLLPPCGHPQCYRGSISNSSSSGTGYLPYAGLGSAWIPEILTLQGLPVAQPQVHSTATCRGRCSSCRGLAQPPPSYDKLFLDEQPPAYNDSVVIKEYNEEDEHLTDNFCVEIADDGPCTFSIESEANGIAKVDSNLQSSNVEGDQN